MDEEIELNEDENNGGEQGDEAAEDLNEGVQMEVFGNQQAAALRSQYDRVAGQVNNFYEEVGQPLAIQMSTSENISTIVNPPVGNPNNVQPNLQYDAPELIHDPDVPVPVPQYGQLVLRPRSGPIASNYAPGPVPTSPSQAAVAQAAGEVSVAMNVNDGVRDTAAKRSLAITAGLVGGGTLVGLAAGITGTYFLYNKLFASATALNGTDGVGPSSTIRLSDALNFGSVKVGTTKTMTLTITNAGALPIFVAAITLPEGFSGSWTGSIPVGKSQEVTITFAPTQGEVYAGNVIVTSDAKFGANSTSLAGLGLAAGVDPAPAIALAGFFDFGEVPVGQTRFTSLTIHNSGLALLTVTGITMPEGFTAAWTGTIAPGSITVVQVLFAPSSVQVYSGNLTVSSDAKAGSGAVAVAGSGVAPTGDTDKDFTALADSLVSQWNEQLDETAFWNAAATWAGTATGTPPLAPSLKMQLIVLLYAYTLATYYMPPIVADPADIEDMVNHLKRQRDTSGWDTATLYLRASVLTSPATQVPLYRYEKLNILARVIGLIIQDAAQQQKLAAKS